jgi:hypothetical protein
MQKLFQSTQFPRSCNFKQYPKAFRCNLSKIIRTRMEAGEEWKKSKTSSPGCKILDTSETAR